MIPNEPTGVVVVATLGHLSGIELSSGATRWSMDLGGHGALTQRASVDIAIEGGRVFVAAAGKLTCVDQATGAGIFQVALASAGRHHDTALLLVAEGVLVHQPGLLSLVAYDGRLLWTRELHKASVPLLGGVPGPAAFGVSGAVRQIDAIGKE